MFRNYLTVALRNIARHRLYSFINIAGLALALACAILIILFIRYETSYDKWLPNSSHLYKLEQTTHVFGRPAIDSVSVPFPVPAAMKEEIPEVTAATRVRLEYMTMTVGDRQFLQGVDVVDPNFLQIVQLSLVSGDSARVLSQPESLVLSEQTARKFFGDANPVGQAITVPKPNCADADVACRGATISLRVTGVLRNLPANSQLVADAIMPNNSIADRETQQQKEDWFSPRYYGFLVLAPDAVPQAVIAKLAPILDRGAAAALRDLHVSAQASQLFEMHLIPFADVHLSSGGYADNMMTPAGSWITVYGIAAIGVLILLIACFNFMNLSTARAAMRAREIALRKTMGATRGQLVIQFLGEAVLMALFALVLAISVAEVILPAFDTFLQRPIAFHYLSDWPLLLGLLGVAIIAGIVSGFYPALVLSGFRPARVLRTNNSGQAGTGHLRVILVVLQFAISVGLGIAAIVVFRQISYARNLDLGFHESNVVAISASELTPSGRESLAQTLRSYPGVLAIALSSAVPFMGNNALGLAQIPGQPDAISINRIVCSADFLHVYDIPLIAGRLLSDSRETDTLNDNNGTPAPTNEGHNVLLNVAAAARFGYTPQQVIGKTIIFNGSHVNVVGVVGDVKMEGAREPVKPTLFLNDPNATWMLSVRLAGQDIPGALTFIDKTTRAFSPATSFWRYFLSDSLGALYQSDEKQGVMFSVCVAIAILIACLGLFGIAAFTTQRRTREIGVRKVFGARIVDIVAILLWQFSIPVLIANLIAWPVAWYYLKGWLENFAYRIGLSPLYFLGAGLIALLIAWLTIAGHAISVARGNAVEALRHE